MNEARHKRVRLCVLGVVFVLGLVMLDASVADATPPEWKLKGSTLEKEVEVSGSLNELATFTIVPISTVIQCSTLTFDKFMLQKGGLLDGTMLLSSCLMFISGKATPVCNPVNPIEAKLKGRLILHEKTTYILFEPLEEEENAAFVIYFPEKCSLGALGFPWGLGRSFVVECSACESEKATHTWSVSSGLESLFPKDTLKLEGSGETHFKFSANVDLSGFNKGLGWSGIG
jgi:hypothetical protein